MRVLSDPEVSITDPIVYVARIVKGHRYASAQSPYHVDRKLFKMLEFRGEGTETIRHISIVLMKTRLIESPRCWLVSYWKASQINVELICASAYVRRKIDQDLFHGIKQGRCERRASQARRTIAEGRMICMSVTSCQASKLHDFPHISVGPMLTPWLTPGGADSGQNGIPTSGLNKCETTNLTGYAVLLVPCM